MIWLDALNEIEQSNGKNYVEVEAEELVEGINDLPRMVPLLFRN